jgi:hypothetical protein
LFQAAYNVTDGPVLIDQYGRSIGGREFAPVDVDQEAAQAAIAGGSIRIYDEGQITSGANPDALDAARRANAWNGRVVAVAALGISKLTNELANFEGSSDPMGDLVRTESIELPVVRPAKKEQAES